MLVLIRGGGDLASGVALRLHLVGMQVVISELPQPLAVRRTVSFADAIYSGATEVERRAVRDAILEAGRVRLRPIVMTTVTTVLGLTPMALGIGRGADLRAPLAIAVIGGLLVATFLTLIVVPVVYSLVEGLRVRVAGVAGSALSSEAARGAGDR